LYFLIGTVGKIGPIVKLFGCTDFNRPFAVGEVSVSLAGHLGGQVGGVVMEKWLANQIFTLVF
jgi:membrane associated rhomboid family serine protease